MPPHWAKLGLLGSTGTGWAQIKPKLGPSWLLLSPTSRQGLPILTPRLLFVPIKPRFFLLCPIPWVRALLVVKRLQSQFGGAFVYIQFCCVLFFRAR
jgi:hypothetical protein